MKRLLFCLSFVVCHLFFGSIAAHAQTGLKVNELFQGRVIPQERMIETRVRGKTLEKYRLTYYRSLRFNATEEESKRLRQLMDGDSQGCFAYISDRKNTFTYKWQAPALGGKNRFVCYQEQWANKADSCEVTVIYMEGTVGSLGQLEELLK